MIDNSSHSPENIRQRLEKLRLWQEEQQKILVEKQNLQRETLSKEQKEVYEKLGLKQGFDEKNNKEGSVSSNSNGSKKTAECDSKLGKLRKSATPPVNRVKRPFLKRGEGLKSRFGIDPDALRLQNLPKYKYANVHKNLGKTSKSAKKKVCVGKTSVSESQLKPEEARQQQTVNFENVHLAKQVTAQTVDQYEHIHPHSAEDQRARLNSYTDDASGNGKLDESLYSHISWAEALRASSSVSVSVERHRFLNTTELSQSFDDDDDTGLFELLEQKLRDEGFRENLRRQTENKTNADGISDKEEKALKRLAIEQKLFELNDQSLKDESETEDEGSSDASEESSEKEMHVRFAEQIEINEINAEEDSGFLSKRTGPKSSTPRANLNMETFDSFSEQMLEDPSLVISDQQRSDILKYRDLLKSRLADLENEIANFQKHNAEVLALKQQYEMDKVCLMQEHAELKEKLDDERVRLEIYLHDERMKIEEDKKRYEKLIKESKQPNRREREEISKLKEEVETLKAAIKEKESKHVSAQARMRATIRNLEKEQRELVLEYEHLKKENKRLESEVTRLNRYNNNKMLKEINKSIAKLAVKPPDGNAKGNQSKASKSVCNEKVVSRRSADRTNVSALRNKTELTEESDSEENMEEDDSSTSIDETASILPRKIHCSAKKENEHSTRLDENKPKLNLKREIQNADGSKDIWYPNGNLKKISADGMLIRMLYYNKDIKETNITEGTVKYYYFETNTWHTTYLDGFEILEFPNGQTEHRHKDGTIEVHFPNGSIRTSKPSDPEKLEEWKYPDGATLVKLKNGDKILTFPNGQKEIHTKEHKRREYPDGTVKLVYPDGSQETRYSNGRVRLKDQDGNLVVDSGAK